MLAQSAADCDDRTCRIGLPEEVAGRDLTGAIGGIARDIDNHCPSIRSPACLGNILAAQVVTELDVGKERVYPSAPQNGDRCFPGGCLEYDPPVGPEGVSQLVS